MEYKIHVSGYLEDSHQLLVSFSCEDTKHEARDYQSFSFDIAPYGDISVEDVLKEIAKQAPILCEEIIMYETIKNKDEKAEGFRALVGQEFSYNNKDLFVTDAVQLAKESAPEAVESETL